MCYKDTSVVGAVEVLLGSYACVTCLTTCIVQSGDVAGTSRSFRQRKQAKET